MKGRINKYFSGVLSFRVKGWIFSGIFGIFVVLCFYAIQWAVPASNPNYDEIVTVLFIILSVLILFPARERLLKFIFKKQEYFSFFGREFHHLDFIARQFTYEAMVEEIFPELLAWLRVRSGKLAILDSLRRDLKLHSYRRGVIREDRMHSRYPIKKLTEYVLQNPGILRIDRPNIPEVESEFLRKFNAAVLQPFMHRRRLLGFLILHEMPRNRFFQRALDLFAGKAAVSIQNYILSSKIIDSRMYEQEFSAAEKIRNLLQSSKIPELHHISIRNLKRKSFPCILEFFQSESGKWFLVILCTPRLTSAAGILLYGVLGHLYSYIHTEKSIQLNRLLSHLRHDPELSTAEYRMDILVAEIQPQEQILTTLIDGKNFRVKNALTDEPIVISSGWRNFLELKTGSPVRIEYASEKLLEFSAQDMTFSEALPAGKESANPSTSLKDERDPK